MRLLTALCLVLALGLIAPQGIEQAHADPVDKVEERGKRAAKKQARQKARREERQRKRRAANAARESEAEEEEEEMVFEPDPPEAAPPTSDALDFSAESAKEEEPVPAVAKARHPSVLDTEPAERTRFYTRVGVLHMQPNVSSGNVEMSNLSSFAELAIDPGPIPNSGADVDNVTVPVATIGYVLPWLDGQLSVETLLGLPVELKLKATGAMATESIAPFALGNVPTGVPAIGKELGTAKVLPPIVTAVYRFLPESIVHPYVGAGLSYMHIYDAKVTNPILVDVAEPNLEVDDAFGVVAQVGVEINIHGRYYAMLDLKTILGLQMSAKVKDIYIRTPELPVFEMAHAGDASIDISMLPLIGTAAVGADF